MKTRKRAREEKQAEQANAESIRDRALWVAMQHPHVNPLLVRNMGLANKALHLCTPSAMSLKLRHLDAVSIDLRWTYSLDGDLARRHIAALPEDFFDRVREIGVTVPLSWAVPGISISKRAGHHNDFWVAPRPGWWSQYSPCVLDDFLTKFRNATSMAIVVLVPDDEPADRLPLTLFCPPERTERLAIRLFRATRHSAGQVPTGHVAARKNTPRGYKISNGMDAPDGDRWKIRRRPKDSSEEWLGGFFWPFRTDMLRECRGLAVLHLAGYASVFGKSWPNLTSVTVHNVWASMYNPEASLPDLKYIRAFGAYGGLLEGGLSGTRGMVFPPKCRLVQGRTICPEYFVNRFRINDAAGREMVFVTEWPPLQRTTYRTMLAYVPDGVYVILELLPRPEDADPSWWQLEWFGEPPKNVFLDLRNVPADQKADLQEYQHIIDPAEFPETLANFLYEQT